MSLLCSACAGPSKPKVEPVKLTLFGLSLESAAQLREDALDEFTRRTGIEVEAIPTLGTSDEQLKLALRLLERRESAPDVFLMDVTWPGTLEGDLLDLRAYLSEPDSQHLSALIDNNTIDTRLVALPFYVNAGVLFYRADLLDAYGYSSPPKTWAELDRMARGIQAGERKKTGRPFWGYVWQGAAYEGLTCNALEWQRSYGGGTILERDGSVSVNNPRVAQALATAKRRLNVISPPSVLSYMETDSLSVFQAGNAAFLRYWSSGFRSVEKLRHGRAALALLPAGPAGQAQTVGGFQLGVSRYTSHAKQAASLVSYLTGSEVQKRRAVRRGFVPTRPALYEDPDVKTALPQVATLQGAPSSSWVLRPASVAGSRYAEVSRAYSEMVHGVLAERVNLKPGLQQLEQRLRQVMETPASGRN